MIIIKINRNILRITLKTILIVIFILLVGKFATQTYSLYESRVKLNANVDKAIYLLSDEKMNFNIDSSGIYPKDDPYIYTFTVSNFKGEKEGEFDLEYYINITTTTNLPITLKLYRNEQYSANATNLLTTNELLRDDDGAWYKRYNNTPTYDLDCDYRVTDTYTLVVDYPKVYSTHPEYEGVPENIEVGIYSKQKV